ncbi:putative ribonuclease H-like domain-containing protein [Tanacetum coccineum]
MMHKHLTRSSSSLDSEVDSCSKSCVKAYATLKEQYDSLSSDYKKSQFNLVSYKAGLESVEARLAHYKKNEAVFEESINVLNLEVKLRDNALVENKKKLEKAEKERDELKLTLENFSTAASPAVESFVNSSEMLENQEYNKSKSDKGYHAVPPPYTGNFIPFKPDLTFMDEIVKRNKCYLTEYEDYDGGFVSFGDGKGRISRKGKIKTGTLDFDNVYFYKELKYNLFSVSQICDKNNNVLFTDTECLVLSSDFKLLDESQVLLRVPRKDNIYSVDLKSVVPTKGLTCLFAKATIDESNFWHRRLGHINFKNMNKLVRGNLVRGLPSKIFENDHSCVACQKGKQHKASWKAKLVNSISKPLHILHMDLFGPTNVKSLMKKSYCLVVTDDFSRFPWGIKREFSIARTPQQNGVTERRNRTLIEAARTMLVNFKLPTTFWAEAVNTACYVLNRVLVIKPHNKTPYELIHGRTPLIDFMKPFRCPVTILNTRDHLGKFDGKANEGFFAGYSVVSKAMRVFNKRIRIVEETLNIRFLENTPNVTGNGPYWLFDVDSLTISMNYMPVVAENQTNGIAGTRDNIVIVPKDSKEDSGMKPTEVDVSGASDKDGEDDQATRINAARTSEEHLFKQFSPLKNAFTLPHVPNVFSIDDTRIFGNAYDDEDVGAEADLNNLETTMNVSPIPTTRIDKNHPKDQIIGDLTLAIKIRRMTKISDEHAMVFRNKKDERGIVIRNKARLVAQGYTQEEGIDYDEVFAHVVRIEEIRLFLAYASFMGFIVYQMDVKSAFLYGTIEEEVEKALYGLHQAPKAWYETLSTYLFENEFRRGSSPDIVYFRKRSRSDKVLLIQNFSKSSDTTCEVSTPIEPNKALIKDVEADSIDVHLYRSMIGSLMYLTASRPDIMFVVYACARDSPFDLEAFSDSDYAGASLDRKSTIGGCQFLGKRLISWQCKKQTIVANSTTEAEYVAAANCCGQISLSTAGLSLYCWMKLCTKVDAARLKENAEFHQIVDFLSTCSINYALTVSPTIYASYIEQFWNTATSKTVNSVKQIHAIVDGKAVVISESSVRSDLLFNDEDGIACLTNDEIFENLALMGYEQLSTKLTFQKEPQTESLQTETPLTVSHELHTEAHIEQILPSPSTYQRKTQKHRRAKKVTKLPQTSVPLDHGADEAPRNHGGAHAQTRSKRVLEKPNEPPLLEGHTSVSGEGNMEHTFELTDNVPNTPHDSPLLGGYTPGSDEGRMELIQELMETCTSLTKRVLTLEEAKAAQDRVITRLKLRVKKLEKKRKERTPQTMIRRLFKGRVESSDDDLDEEDAYKQGRKSDKKKPMFKDSDFYGLDDDMENVEGETVYAATFGVSTARPTVSTVGPSTSAVGTSTGILEDEMVTMADTLIAIRQTRTRPSYLPRPTSVVITDTEQEQRRLTTPPPSQPLDTRDKGKGIMVEPDPPVKIKRSDQGDLQLQADAELAQLLHQEELAQVERRQRERAAQEEASIAALYEEYDTIQASIDADALFAARLQQEEREQFTIEERAQFLVETIAAQRKFRAAQRAVKIRSKPPTKTQIRNMMITYLKNIERQKNKESCISTLKQKSSKKQKDYQKIRNDKRDEDRSSQTIEHEQEVLRMWLTVVPDEEETVDLKILSTKYPIVDWESQNLGNVEMEDLHVIIQYAEKV